MVGEVQLEVNEAVVESDSKAGDGGDGVTSGVRGELSGLVAWGAIDALVDEELASEHDSLAASTRHGGNDADVDSAVLHHASTSTCAPACCSHTAPMEEDLAEPQPRPRQTSPAPTEYVSNTLGLLMTPAYGTLDLNGLDPNDKEAPGQRFAPIEKWRPGSSLKWLA